MQPDSQENPTEPPAKRSGAWWAAVVLTLAALGLTGFITLQTVTGDGALPGCGVATEILAEELAAASDAESHSMEASDLPGCGAVLVTKWSDFLGLPVSALAAGLYLVMLVTLLKQKSLGGLVLGTGAVLVIGAGLWFTYVQVFELRAMCPYCIASHAVGLVLAIVLLTHTAKRLLPPCLAIGMVGTAVLAAVQLNSTDPVIIIESGGGTRDGHTLSLLEDRLTLDLREEMVVGDVSQLDRPDGWLVVKMFDYNCPHCRHAHEVVSQMNNLAVVLVPVPLDPRYNPYQREFPNDNFKHSHELARIALAIHRIDPEKLQAYEDWVYGEGWPQTTEAAQAFAGSLVGRLPLDMHLNNPEINAILERNVDAWGKAGVAGLVGGLPIHLVPDGGLTYGGVGDGTGIVQLLNGTHRSQQTEEVDE
ncbi:vitamin K epoxide reductase family protein [Algisphaera agarilytica]|uniref:Putative membrane protein n=1 Tax=Algisphaera agarilytica TaxID=1385975 RepID=A0A7X0LK78_9BACT|nr:vitamin K epoxide reductase family protein [Algisphaera agarilytica]MBB6429554.1 putative membrane protein [Algisphaera agarilytica]